LYSVILLAFVIFNDTIFYPDSQGYVDMDLNRSIGYPLFIEFHRVLFGGNSISVIAYTQFFLLLASAIFFVKSLRNTLHLNKWTLFTIFIVVLTPVFYELKLANSLLSESVAYPLYLFTIGNLLIAIFQNRKKNFYYALLLLYLLICVRGQFLFLLPIIVVTALFHDGNRNFTKDKIILLLSTFAVFFTSILTDVVFHKIQHGYATTTPWTGIQISTLAFFTADKNDADALKTKDQKEYFYHIYKQISNKKLLLSQIDDTVDVTDFYYDNYVSICNGTINEQGELFFTNRGNQEEQTILNDKMSASITIPLIMDNFQKWFLMYFRIIVKGFGSAKYMIAFLFLLIASTGIFIKSKNKISKVLILFCLLLFGNIVLVALAEPAISRYTFYNNWILITILLYLFQQSFQKKSND